MKYFIIALILFVSSLNASPYIRSIRLGSYTTESAAKKTVKEAQKFLERDKKMREYQKKYNFHFTIIPAKNYFLVALEPLRDKKVVQEMLDTLRKKYKSAYPKKLTSLPKDFQKQKEKQHSRTIQKPKATKEINTTVASVKKVQQKTPVAVEEKVQKVLEKPQKRKEDFGTIVIPLLAVAVFMSVALFIIVFLLMRKNTRLRQKNEMMVFDLSNKTRSLQAKEKILSHVSHELRNPLASVLGLSQLILENDLPLFQKENVQNIEQSAEKALEIIDDILNISKINAGELRIENKEFNINTMLEDVLNTTYLQAKHNNVDVILDVAENVPARIISDSLRLGQVIINLLSNAIKFSKNGTVYLKVIKKEIRAQSVILEFSVSDDGIGMTQEQLERIFDSYVQAEESTSREFGGTGLGLAISKELIEKMGGKIKVRSQKDVGTTFVFSVEARLFDMENKRHYHLPSKEYLHKNVLIVENSNKNVIALLRAFRYFKYKTHVIPSLDENILREGTKYDIIIINQTQIDEKAIEKLQKMHFTNRAKTKIILTTYRFTKIDEEIMEKLDISAYLKIPFTQQNVLESLIGMYDAKEVNPAPTLQTTKEKLKKLSLTKILVAEDNVLNHKVLAGLLEKTGAEVTFVTNGQEVISLIKKGNQYSLILMDIEMPVVNGFDAALEIRKDKKNNAIPIIALSAKNDTASQERAFAVGMQAYLTKPISLDDFYNKIYDVVSHEVKINVDKNEKNRESKEELSTLRELGKFQGEDKFYTSLLRDFQTMYAHATESLHRLVKGQKYKEAIMLVRDIKDVSLNIGAYTLAESAAGLEYELERQEYSKILKVFQDFEAHFLQLLGEIERYLEKK
jgi:signal transduction histidine kinase/CheY-like chemotaxis protein